MKLETLEQLFIDELQDLHGAETMLIKALPQMADAAHSAQLRQAFQDHLEETRGHVERIEHILEKIQNGKVKGKKCKGMEGLIDEGNERIKASGDPAVVDAGLIAAAQRIEHYEIAAYGCAKTYAELLGDDASCRLLEQTLDEEKAADEKLTELAMTLINPQAARA
ncbi:MAG TPA: ferritin-like domain-containing protein [Phycisphaerae bacterium]|nr:ferritin-like domain-containing protein [Phycisphaerae bacterium]